MKFYIPHKREGMAYQLDTIGDPVLGLLFSVYYPLREDGRMGKLPDHYSFRNLEGCKEFHGHLIEEE